MSIPARKRAQRRIDSSERWRKRARNRKGVWQNRQAHTQPRVISIGPMRPARGANGGTASRSTGRARSLLRTPPPSSHASPGPERGSSPTEMRASSAGKLSSPSPIATRSNPAASVPAGSALACGPPATCSTRPSGTASRTRASSEATSAKLAL